MVDLDLHGLPQDVTISAIPKYSQPKAYPTRAGISYGENRGGGN